MKHGILFIIFTVTALYITCEPDNPSNIPVLNDSLPVIVYTSMSGDMNSKIHIIQNDIDKTLFPSDTTKRSYISFNIKNKKIAYMKNFAVFPMVGPVGEPSITTAEMDGSNEKTLIPYNSSVKYHFPFWISESEIALLKQTLDTTSYLVIVDSKTGTISKEMELNLTIDIYNCKIFKAQDSLLCCVSFNYIGIIDLKTRTVKNELSEDLASYFETIQHPLVYNKKIFFLRSRFPYSYKVYDIENNSFSDFSFAVDSVEVVHITDNQRIVYDHDPYPENCRLKVCDTLFNVSSQVAQQMDGMLPYFDSSTVYCLTEAPADDAYVLVKVNFVNSSCTYITEIIEDNFIFNGEIYY